MLFRSYTGEIKGRNERSPFFLTMFKLHRWLLDSAKPEGGIFWGKMIVGISTIMFVFVLITGVVIWVPRTRKALNNRLKVVTNKGWKRFWYDLHVSAGIYATILLLIMGLTGLTWSFPWYRNAFYKVFGVEVTAPLHGGQPGNPAGAPVNNERPANAQNGRPDGAERGNRPERSADFQKERNQLVTGVQEGTERKERPNRENVENGTRSERNNKFASWNKVYQQVAILEIGRASCRERVSSPV